MVVKGQEFAGYDSRALQGMGLGYATSNRGACHLKHDVFGPDMEKTRPAAARPSPAKTARTSSPCSTRPASVLFTAGAGMKPNAFTELMDAACEGEWTDELHAHVGRADMERWSACSTTEGRPSPRTDDDLPKPASRRFPRRPAPPRARSRRSTKCCLNITSIAVGRLTANRPPRRCSGWALTETMGA